MQNFLNFAQTSLKPILGVLLFSIIPQTIISSVFFICYAASVNRFGDCHPVLGLNRAHLKAKYLDILLATTGIDANGALFPLAYTVVDTENDDNWFWFNALLRKVIGKYATGYLVGQTLTFISDHQKDLLDSIERVFPGSTHSYCL